MIYLDYSATTKADKEVLETFVKVNTNYFGNPNSLHKLGVEAKELIEEATKKISLNLNVLKENIIYTSGATEANNLVLKGVTERNKGMHIITSSLEHSSIYGPVSELQKKGFKIDFVNLDNNGLVDLNHLKELLTNDTILVSIASVNSETGILQPIESIAEIVKRYSKAYFHSDMTQSIGKVSVNIENVDLISLSAHKIYGIKGIGILIKKDNVKLKPLLHGGHSTTIYRSGTPTTSLIASMSKAITLAINNLNTNYEKVYEINQYLINKLSDYSYIFINSNEHSIPHILNISLKGIKPLVFQTALSQKNIYISTQSACSGKNEISSSVLAITNNEQLAKTCLRISLSHLTTKKEIDCFVNELINLYERLDINENN